MNFFDLANLLDNDGNLQNEMMVMSFAATLLATIPVRSRERWDSRLYVLSQKFYYNVFLFVDLTTFGTFDKFWLVASWSWVYKRFNH